MSFISRVLLLGAAMGGMFLAGRASISPAPAVPESMRITKDLAPAAKAGPAPETMDLQEVMKRIARAGGHNPQIAAANAKAEERPEPPAQQDGTEESGVNPAVANQRQMSVYEDIPEAERERAEKAGLRFVGFTRNAEGFQQAEFTQVE